MQRTFFIFFLLLAFVNISFWTIQFQNESGSYHLFVSKKEILKKHSQLISHTQKLDACKVHSFPSQDNTTLTNLPFEDEDKDEVENETLIGEVFYSLDIPITKSLFSGNTVSSYERLFFKRHFLDIFSPPPNC